MIICKRDAKPSWTQRKMSVSGAPRSATTTSQIPSELPVLFEHFPGRERFGKMASQVPPSKKPTPWADRPLPPSSELEKPEDYKKTFRVGVVLLFAATCTQLAIGLHWSRIQLTCRAAQQSARSASSTLDTS